MFTKAVNLILLLVFTGSAILAQVPTKWRGPNGNGVYNDTGLLKKWPASGPEIIWHFDGLGEGHSSPVFANGAIYLSGMEETTGYIYVLSTAGGLKWKVPYGEEFHESYPGSRSTPVIVGDLLYIYSGLGVLTCMDANNGDVKWRKDVFKDFDGKNIRWGVTETPVVNDDLIYITPGGKKDNVVAMNRFAGDLVWSSPGKGETSAYCTPLLIEFPSRKLLVTHTADHIIGIDAKDGKMLWSYPQTNRWQVHANTPIYYNGGLFCFSGYGQGGVKLELTDDGSSVEKAWFNDKLDNRIGGMVLIEGYLYGSGDNNRQWRCVDWKTGEEKYVSTDIGKGVTVAADGMLFCYSERGELALVEATPAGFNPTGKTKVELGSAQHWAHPVVNDGKLYLRHGNTLIAYKVK
ncbi:Outer membrane protein assembly factor BamB, contains PQQ-like beta-propeller repeat [Mariniphaga anaerophila]|uniref:Outer membrane protein assembly factor BamB, contains PQQ-like beta-propeller repeat n=1 Tax=Mariniphaga anaerophila TaxID=1484053 RepID=A0A1M5DPI6_9BACT|nr:PQQ-binding-like beta-propeller repeat protein [Mariniphaga anaerophila]SHF68815.1 Outer membrane protein assembly factor BamB, contains PQQ-like beta-propeller repeat [Mariniphaga anaerophila]